MGNFLCMYSGSQGKNNISFGFLLLIQELQLALGSDATLPVTIVKIKSFKSRSEDMYGSFVLHISFMLHHRIMSQIYNNNSLSIQNLAPYQLLQLCVKRQQKIAFAAYNFRSIY